MPHFMAHIIILSCGGVNNVLVSIGIITIADFELQAQGRAPQG
jgi:hypothetical protein